jgi:hypothetical protein
MIYDLRVFHPKIVVTIALLSTQQRWVTATSPLVTPPPR